jgi:hypothetical protein
VKDVLGSLHLRFLLLLFSVSFNAMRRDSPPRRFLSLHRNEEIFPSSFSEHDEGFSFSPFPCLLQRDQKGKPFVVVFSFADK